ncbi:MAG TPA: DUF5996 family protein [Ktedonobacteraceae bacterium]|nr:DUF5996 family protein [Ktedonobacteraceae bacterium]
MTNEKTWPSLPFDSCKDTHETLHMWTQVVGKIRLSLSPYLNHWWHAPLYVATRGLTTSPIPYQEGVFEITFDFIEHNLLIQTSEGTSKALPLVSRSVADFYREVMESLHTLGIEVTINTLPNEVKNPIRFEQDEIHATYDPVTAYHLWRILLQTDKVMRRYRSQFTGKSSPIHFFWGSFDLALTFFSGRRAPERPGADRITQEAYSQEVISCGFWPGDGTFPRPAFYSYTAPAPQGLEKVTIKPEAAVYSPDMGEFFLLYDDLRLSDTPEQDLFDFFQSTYEAGTTLAHWDRKSLERTK